MSFDAEYQTILQAMYQLKAETGRYPKNALIVTETVERALGLTLKLEKAGMENVTFRIIESNEDLTMDKLLGIIKESVDGMEFED